MATQIENDTYEFPDEKEAKSSEQKFEVEIEDDTPVEDRGRKSSGPIEEPADEELSKYSKDVQERVGKLKRGYHDERRAKEKADRERLAAEEFAAQVYEENKRLKGQLKYGSEVFIEQNKSTAHMALDAAKKRYKEAYESGDADKLLDAQEALTTARIRADKVNNFRPAPLQEQETPVQIAPQPQQAAPVDEKLLAWQDQNQWFGSNKRMTSYALGLHEELVENGIRVGSDEYYRRIDTDIRERFPDQVGVGESADAKPQRTKSNVVSPATRSTAPKKIVLTQTQVNLAKRLGVPLELYARKVAEEMRK
jgi:hypothetical protein